MSLSTVITDAIAAKPDASAVDVARDVFTKIKKEDMFPLLVSAVEHHQRAAVRRNERSVTIQRLGPLLAKSTTLAAAFNETEESNRQRLLDLMNQTWRLGDGERVVIGRATVSEIEQRLEMLRKQHAGLGQTIKVLESVKAELIRTGAKCLDDLLAQVEAAA